MRVIRDDDRTLKRSRSAAAQLLQQASALVICDEASLKAAGDLIRDIRGGQRTVKDFFAPTKRAADSLHDMICKQEKGVLAQFVEPDRIVSEKLRQYEIDRRKRVADAQKSTEHLALRNAIDGQVDRAVHLDEIGKATGDETFRVAAQQELDRPVQLPAIVLPPPPKIEGVSMAGDIVSVRLDDIKALCRAVADGKVLPGAVEWAESWLRKKAESDGEAFDVPGVTRLTTPRLSVRS